MPSWGPTTLPANWSSQHCNQRVPRSTRGGSPCACFDNTMPSWEPTILPSNWSNQRCNQRVPRVEAVALAAVVAAEAVGEAGVAESLGNLCSHASSNK